MKINDAFILCEVAGENVVLPSGDELNLNIMITLNESGRFLWEQLREDKTEDELIQAVVANYDNIDLEEAKVFVRDFIAQLNEHKFIE